jgi:hypothetical protein
MKNIIAVSILVWALVKKPGIPPLLAAPKDPGRPIEIARRVVAGGTTTLAHF